MAAVDPREPGHYPACPVLALTGLYCPACGGLRSAHDLAHGDLAGALGANAVAVAGFAALAVGLVAWLVLVWRGAAFTPVIRPAHGWAAGGALAAFTVVRNLPFGAALIP